MQAHECTVKVEPVTMHGIAAQTAHCKLNERTKPRAIEEEKKNEVFEKKQKIGSSGEWEKFPSYAVLNHFKFV